MLDGVRPTMSLLVERLAVLFESKTTAVVPLGAPVVQLAALLQLVLVVPLHDVDWPEAAEAEIRAAPTTTNPSVREAQWSDIADSLAGRGFAERGRHVRQQS